MKKEELENELKEIESKERREQLRVQKQCREEKRKELRKQYRKKLAEKKVEEKKELEKKEALKQRRQTRWDKMVEPEMVDGKYKLKAIPLKLTIPEASFEFTFIDGIEYIIRKESDKWRMYNKETDNQRKAYIKSNEKGIPNGFKVEHAVCLKHPETRRDHEWLWTEYSFEYDFTPEFKLRSTIKELQSTLKETKSQLETTQQNLQKTQDVLRKTKKKVKKQSLQIKEYTEKNKALQKELDSTLGRRLKKALHSK